MLSAFLAILLAANQSSAPGVWAIATHDDYLAAAYDEKYVDLWLLSTGKHVRRFKYAGFSEAGDTSNALIVSLDFSPDGSLLVGGSEESHNSYAPVWEVNTGREIAKLGLFSGKDLAEAPTQTFFSADGQYVFGTSNRANAWNFYAWDPRGGCLKYVSGGGAEGMHAVSGIGGPGIHAMTGLLASDSGQGRLQFWDIDGGAQIDAWQNATIQLPPIKDYTQVRVIEGGAKLLIAGEQSEENEESFVCIATRKDQTSATLPGIRVRSIAVSPDEHTLYLGGLNGKLWQYSLLNGKFIIGKTVPDEGNVRALAVTRDGQFLIAGTETYHSDKAVAGGSITVWSTKDLTLVRTIQPAP